MLHVCGSICVIGAPSVSKHLFMAPHKQFIQLQKWKLESGKMPRGLRANTALAKDPNSSPTTHLLALNHM